MELLGEERRETFPPTGEIRERFDAELLQQISCEAFVSPRANHKAAQCSLHPGPTPHTNHHRSITYQHLAAAV